MTVFRNYRDLSLVPRVVCLGNFDGVHRGHQTVIQRAVDEAKRLQLVSNIFTFAPHPREFFGSSLESLVGLDDRLELLGRFGIDEILVQTFDAEFSKVTAQAFVEDILISQLQAKAVVIGRRFHFGFQAKGTSEFLKSYASDFTTIEVASVLESGLDISSSQIRHLIKAGQVHEAEALFNYIPFISGAVVAGDSRGRALGFPTANLAHDDKTIASHYPHGVYACMALEPLSGFVFQAVANFGMRPTFRERKPIWEIHFLNFNDDLYGKRLRIFILDFIRPEQAFESVEHLKKQIEIDCQKASRYLSGALSSATTKGVKSATLTRAGDGSKPWSLTNPDPSLQSFQAFRF